MRQKKLILTVVDSLQPAALEKYLGRGSVPAFDFLVQNGFYHRDCVSSFPTMTPTASAAIATGCGPGEHLVPGFVWYDRERKEHINYGATLAAILKLGPCQVLENLLYRLNDTHLGKKVSTIYELLAAQGITSACYNFFIYRGNKEQEVVIPLSLKLSSLFQLSSRKLFGPDQLILGKLTKRGAQIPWFWKSPFQKLGVNDTFVSEALKWDVENGRQADFSLVYFPDTDHFIHVHNTSGYKKSIIRVDRQLQKVLNCFSSWAQALEENVIMLCGDHAQSDIGSKKEALINLDHILSDFPRMGLRDRAETGKEIVVCCNERMAAVEILKDSEIVRDQVIAKLLPDKRIELIMWHKDGRYFVRQGGSERMLSFAPGEDIRDNWGAAWNIDGDISALNGEIKEGIFYSDDFPDALTRIKQALDCRVGMRILLSAVPGCEFLNEAAPVHPNGGSHGSIHRVDSLVPLIISGSDQDLNKPRIYDIKEYILNHFNRR